MKLVFSTIVFTAAFAASTFSPQAAGRIASRAENQQDRIAQGVKSGHLNASQTAHLETKKRPSIKKYAPSGP